MSYFHQGNYSLAKMIIENVCLIKVVEFIACKVTIESCSLNIILLCHTIKGSINRVKKYENVPIN